ncbi:DUF4269 domain-containing protein [Bradyrhizobium prioriisuperbiae]|uniref:DUF4269 domain-containing protein n=1 Tax=Bradyrhizobium prioriisuperbiae TaxID=2854389 RepID=UPI0028EE7EB8|nr:DUF4269 domain-containing protein [Bradyrhizobium prioritasuperba]
MTRCDYRTALDTAGVMTALAAYRPEIAGTPPLGLDLPDSDIDVLCEVTPAAREAFLITLWTTWSYAAGFRVHQWRDNERPIIAGFDASGWSFEIFAHPLPVAQQVAMRHFNIEQRLLRLGGPALHARVLAARRNGLKTEPAFAAVLGLAGDPFAALLALERETNAGLEALLLRI